MKLNLGSGYTSLPGYERVDIDENCNPDIKADIRDLSMIPTDSVEEIYTAHTLEHILLCELFKTLRGFCRVLKPGGLITTIVPDTQTVAYDWINKGLPSQYFEKIVLGVTPNATPHMAHRQLFWEVKMERYMHIAGFVNIISQRKKETYELLTFARKPIRG